MSFFTSTSVGSNNNNKQRNEQRSHMQITILKQQQLAFMFNRIQIFCMISQDERFKDGFGALAFQALLLLVHHHHSLCLLCVSYLLHARFFFHLSIFTSHPNYIFNTPKKKPDHNGTFEKNWTQTTIRFIIFKQQQQQQKNWK